MLGAIAVKERADDAERRIEAAQLGQRQAADPQTGVGARNIEEAGAIGVANADIFNRRRRASRQTGGPSARRRNHSGQRRRSQKKSLEQFLVQFPHGGYCPASASGRAGPAALCRKASCPPCPSHLAPNLSDYILSPRGRQWRPGLIRAQSPSWA